MHIRAPASQRGMWMLFAVAHAALVIHHAALMVVLPGGRAADPSPAVPGAVLMPCCNGLDSFETYESCACNRSFLHSPGYRNDAIQCVVRREGGGSKAPTRYSIYLESQNKFLMGASQARSTFQAMGINRAAHYTLSLDPKVPARCSAVHHAPALTL